MLPQQPSPLLLEREPIQRWRSTSSLGEATIWGAAIDQFTEKNPIDQLTGEKKATDAKRRKATHLSGWGSVISLASLSVRTGV